MLTETLKLCRFYAKRKKYGPALTQHELDLYEQASIFTSTLLTLKIEMATLKAEKEIEQYFKGAGT